MCHLKSHRQGEPGSHEFCHGTPRRESLDTRVLPLSNAKVGFVVLAPLASWTPRENCDTSELTTSAMIPTISWRLANNPFPIPATSALPRALLY
jgi:hypothetical protein